VPFRKPLARAGVNGAGERCSSPAYVLCPAVLQRHEDHPALSRCPFLQESLAQFCAGSSVPTYVPWSESPDLRCGHDGHRFCDLYLALSGSGGRGPALRGGDPAEARTASVDGVPMPGWLFYAPNHLWLDVGGDGIVHVGADAFLTQLVGRLERLTFLTTKGTLRPAVVLTVQGVDLTLTFPHPLHIAAANLHLRSGLDRLTDDPYGRGWLFEAHAAGAPRHETTTVSTAGLLRGPAAHAWMAREVRRAASFVHEQVLPGAGEGFVADGGSAAPDLLRHLQREQIHQLFALLFPPPADPRRL
jgi:glycine cleavage system H lipoate-binding protein